ncbi:MAG: alpha-glucosidase C-terminal domain-containing protein [Oscillospiraceae bacterium]|nr:alpha-glucosidase C-terminal domain-containing protein [Oscillospiraceae bacterium]
MHDWYKDAVFYHIYPLGFCGALYRNDFVSEPQHGILKVKEYSNRIAELGTNAVYFGPVCESSYHGYDTADYGRIDRRLGTEDDFADVCQTLHGKGIRVIIDGVFNHTGRDFWAFRDVREKRQGSPYCSWFNLNFGGNSNYNDGFWYEGWEGNYDLVKLNLRNPAVKEHIFGCVKGWYDRFKIDGLRLDVAYLLDRDFLCELRAFCKALSPQFFLLGECLHGDYNMWCNGSMLDSVTNYEVYKGLHSSINSGNMFEIAYSLNRQFGPEQWTIYKGLPLYTFADNHDVSRIASLLKNPETVPLIYSLLASIPGIPSVYYGSEFALKGEKSSGDEVLRPSVEDVLTPAALTSALPQYISALCGARRQSKALCRGSYRQLHVSSCQLVFEREFEGERVICAFNIDSVPATLHFNANAGRAKDLITGADIDFGGGLSLPAYTAYIGLVY